MGENVLEASEPDAASQVERSIRGKFYSPDARCFVETVGGVVHQITTYDSCLVKGFNIIGSKVETVLALLGAGEVRWFIPYPRSPAEKLTVIPDIGLELFVSMISGAVWRVTIRPSAPEYANREETAGSLQGNVVDLRQVRRSRLFGRVDLPMYRPFDNDI